MGMIQLTHVDSPMGRFEITGSEVGIRSVRLTESDVLEWGPKPMGLLAEAVDQLEEYFRRERTSFDLLLDWADAPPFHKEVWRELLRVPYGHTTTYSAIAEKLGDTRKVRAVGQAASRNPIAIIVPCHRVIAKSGDLQGYFYGLDFKRQLLELENPISFSRQGTLFS